MNKNFRCYLPKIKIPQKASKINALRVFIFLEKMIQIAFSCSVILVYYVCRVRGARAKPKPRIKNSGRKTAINQKGKENEEE